MSPAAPPATGLLHDAFFYDTEDALLATAVPFVREGVERGEVVLVNTGHQPVTALLKAMFRDEPTVQYPEASLMQRPVSAIDCFKRIMDSGLAQDVPGYRSIGHAGLGSDVLPWQEWLRYEAAFGAAFAHYPLESICLYDTRSVAGPVLEAMRRVHPCLLQNGRRVPNPEYVEATELVSRPEHATPHDPLQDEAPQLQFDDVTDLRNLRIDLYPATIFTALSRSTCDDFVKAVVEVASNALRHGEGPVCVALWTTADKLLCTVTDQGPGVDGPLKGYARSIGHAGAQSLSTHNGLGLWAARQLCDILDYRRTEDGFCVRLIASGAG